MDSLYRLSHGTLFFQKIISDPLFPCFYRIARPPHFLPNIYLLLFTRVVQALGAGILLPLPRLWHSGFTGLKRARHHYGHCRTHHRICAGFWPYFCRMDCGIHFIGGVFSILCAPLLPWSIVLGIVKLPEEEKHLGRKAGYPLRNTVNHRLLRSFNWRIQPGDLRLFLTCSLRSSGGGDSVHRAFLPAAAGSFPPSS